MTESCSYMTHPGSRWGDSPEPPEFCENEAEGGSEFCSEHIAPDFEPPDYWDED